MFDFSFIDAAKEYYIPSNKRPRRLLNFETVRCGAN